MDNDPQTTSGPQEQPHEERQNRRQFFNGLGKWSLAIIAAVAALRDGLHDVSGIGSHFETGSEGAGDPRQQIAKDPKPYAKRPHTKTWMDYTSHDDTMTRKVPGGTKSPGGTIPSPGGSQDKTQ